MSRGNKAEELIARICRGSFLSLWAYPNPRGKNGKELCDTLVVCEPDILIISVKDIGVPDSGDMAVDWKRWQRRSIEGSVKQIYGAERWLTSASHVVRHDGNPGIPLPPVAERRVYRLAVALGGDGQVPIYMGDFGKGFVHVLDEESVEAVLGELNTITDLVGYVRAKEALYKSGMKVIFQGGERDLLALYLSKGREFPKGADLVVVTDGIWDSFTSCSSYRAKQIADEASRPWDRLVDRLAADMLEGNMAYGEDLADNERAIRVMARESRFHRRVLGKAFKEFMDLAATKTDLGGKTLASRIVPSPSGVVYVFLAKPHGTAREQRKQELALRCIVARGLHPNAVTVVGIATERYEKGQGYSLDLTHVHVPDWTEELQQQMEGIQQDLGYFAQPRATRFSEDEYPSPGRAVPDHTPRGTG